MRKPIIYADHAATTPLSPAAWEAMRPYLENYYGNPSTLYSFAREPRKAVSDARKTIANIIGAEPSEIYFTSGGTEADNWAIKGTAFQYESKKKHIITSAIEHHAVLHPCKFLQGIGWEITFLPVDSEGIVSAKALEESLREDTALVSVMLANNEIGTIEPIRELVEIAHEKGAFFHTDGVQAVGHIPVDVHKLGVDLLSASAHKFNGPKGVGFLYIRQGLKITPLLHGGGQEAGLRSGTENVAGIVGMAAALSEHTAKLHEEAVYLEGLQNRLITNLKQSQLDFLINGAERHIPGSISISFKNAEGEMLLHRLDLMGIAIATGSACNSKETETSHVIKAINTPADYTNGTIRITLGMDNDADQVDRIAEGIKTILE